MRIIDDSELLRELPVTLTADDIKAALAALDDLQGTKAEREYERDEAGRFGTGGGGARVKPDVERFRRQFGAQISAGRPGAATPTTPRPEPAPEDEEPAMPSTVAGLPPELQREMLLVEHVITENDYESGAVFDRNGTRLELISQGQKDSVQFTQKAMLAARGGYLTHNHPSSSSFSKADIQSASNTGLAEIRAVGNDGTVYRMSSTRGETWPSGERIHRELQVAVLAVDSEIKAAHAAGIITTEQANREWNHLAWEKAAPGLGLNYVRDDARRDPLHPTALTRIDREAYDRVTAGAHARAVAELSTRVAAAQAESDAIARAVAAQPSGAEASRARAAARGARPQFTRAEIELARERNRLRGGG